ncbi:hypothetical protein AW53_24635 [Salmonella enterica subsp. enterica serovar Anatum str. USDA-ARS-USMARC-1677]|nr:hypothetical protein AW53_24635 [Salmonella enterica subsp. enterica serovar Anatum str. USDA-ARS-USMARC-1677]
MVCVVGRMRDLILQLSKSSIYSTKPPPGKRSSVFLIFIAYSQEITGQLVLPDLVSERRRDLINREFVMT